MEASGGRIDFDRERFAVWLDRHFGTASMRLERISGGQSNPTYFVDHGSRRMVLRKKPAGNILPGAHAIEREYRVLEALAPTGVPVPRAIHLHEDADVVGTPFYLMERVEGRVFPEAALREADRSERKGLYFAMADTLARLHAVRPAEVGLGDYGKPGSYFDRQFARWTRQYDNSSGERIRPLDELIAWLRDNLPTDDGRVAISHGDFRIGNMMLAPAEAKVVAILDWELSTLGHPLADLGFCCMPWATSPDEYGGVLGLDLADLGLPSREEFLDRYYAQSPDAPRLQAFHVAFALFRFAVIFVGIADRSRAGNAADANAAALQPLAGRFAIRALELIGR